MLVIKDIYAKAQDKAILKGINLTVKPGEVHAIMGPNGSGKSTLANVLAGREHYDVTQGAIEFQGQDLNKLSIEERAHLGLFLALQYPVEIPGVANINFLKAAVNATRTAQNKASLDAIEFLSLVREKLAGIDMPEALLYRSINSGFSGGEKKRNEMLQLTLLEPTLAILDETDSGLDVDALKAVAKGVNNLRNPERAFILVTHYHRLLDYIEPDFIHILMNGKIIRSGDKSLALEIEEKGYGWLEAVA